MPRLARIDVPGLPLHVVQRGVNRVCTFVDDQDRAHYLDLLDRARRRHEVAIHAYVLMSNHVHLLVSAAVEGAVSAAMHRVGSSYVRMFNRRHGRVGTLWQGRFKSCLVDHDRYLLAVYRYIELNPVRAGIVERPEAYRWSSVHGNTGRRHDPLLTPHLTFLATARDPAVRAASYARSLDEALDPDITDAIRRHTAQERVLGPDSLQATLEHQLARPARLTPSGRPPKTGTGAVIPN